MKIEAPDFLLPRVMVVDHLCGPVHELPVGGEDTEAFVAVFVDPFDPTCEPGDHAPVIGEVF